MSWNSKTGHVSGVARKVHQHDFMWKGCMRHCSEAVRQYEIESNKTDHVAMHKDIALERVGS